MIKRSRIINLINVKIIKLYGLLEMKKRKPMSSNSDSSSESSDEEQQFKK